MDTIWVETEIDGDASIEHLLHTDCALNLNGTGRFEDGSYHYGWPNLECANCGELLSRKIGDK